VSDSSAPANDFPYYNGKPVGLSGTRWFLLMAATVLAFAVLTAPVDFFKTTWGQLVPAILFCAIPLLVLAWLTPKHWTAIFHPFKLSHLFIMIGVAVLNTTVTLAIGALYAHFFDVVGNKGVAEGLHGRAPDNVILFFLKTVPQLMGEELITILPFLAIMWVCVSKLNTSRWTALLAAWVITAVIFALLHLPTYGWNVFQCLALIGTARLILSLAYIWTKSIWVSYGSHVIHDWTLFLSTVFLIKPE